MRSEAEGEVESEEGVLILKRIHVRYRLRAGQGADRAAIERAHALHHRQCPIYRSLEGAIGITTELEVEE